jgi:hypothetical protein
VVPATPAALQNAAVFEGAGHGQGALVIALTRDLLGGLQLNVHHYVGSSATDSYMPWIEIRDSRPAQGAFQTSALFLTRDQALALQAALAVAIEKSDALALAGKVQS